MEFVECLPRKYQRRYYQASGRFDGGEGLKKMCIRDRSSYRTLTDNFAIEWNPFEGLTLRGQVGITATDNTSDRFLPAEHSTFTDDSQYETDEGFLRRGTYDYTTGRTNEYTGNITLSYTRTFADKHQVYVCLLYTSRCV